MKILTLVRHAKSSWSDTHLSDRERPLNKRGERDAPKMGERIAEHGIRPSLIVTSPATRAWTTARIIAAEISYPIEFLEREDGLYLASLNELLAIIAEQDNEFNNMMIVGHNPGFTELVNVLTNEKLVNLPTAGIAVIDLPINEWKDVMEVTHGQTGNLKYLSYPKLKE